MRSGEYVCLEVKFFNAGKSLKTNDPFAVQDKVDEVIRNAFPDYDYESDISVEVIESTLDRYIK